MNEQHQQQETKGLSETASKTERSKTQHIKTQRRNTWQRDAVRAELAATPGFVSAQQLHARVTETGQGIGLATVYRALAQLAEDGEADSLQSPDGENLFRYCKSLEHHHHLICRNCGTTHELAAHEVEQWAARIGAEYGFNSIEHVADLFGLCAGCSTSKPQS